MLFALWESVILVSAIGISRYQLGSGGLRRTVSSWRAAMNLSGEALAASFGLKPLSSPTNRYAFD